MAVWNLITLRDIRATRRIDSEYFRPEYAAAEGRARACNEDDLGKLGFFIPGPFGSAFHVENYDYKSSYRYIRGRDVKPFFLLNDDNRYIPESDFKRLKNYEVQNDDLMISVVGTLGNVAVCTEEDTPAMFSCKSTLLRAWRADPYFLLAYMNSTTGQLCLLRRQRGAIQTGLNMEDLRTIPVPRFKDGIEEDIAESIRKAYRKLLESREAYQSAQQLFEAELGLDKLMFEKPRGYTARFSAVGLSDAFSVGRIDAHCFLPETLFYEKWLNNRTQCDRLSSFVRSTAKGHQQTESVDGLTDYCSIKHISNREVVDVSRCSPATAIPIAEPNDLLLAVTGATIGKVGMNKRYERLAFSGDLLCLRPAEHVAPHYLLLALEHRLSQLQFLRWVTGSTNGHLALKDVLRVLVVRLNSDTETKIALLVKASLDKRRESEQLLEKAKNRVERLIEEAVQR